MADHFLADALGYVRRTLAITAEPTSDGGLLELFVRDRDEAAFAQRRRQAIPKHRGCQGGEEAPRPAEMTGPAGECCGKGDAT